MRLIDADAIPWTDLNDDPNSKIRVLVTFADKVNKMPTIEPEQRWIPCSERLPEIGVNVLTVWTYEESEPDVVVASMNEWNGELYFDDVFGEYDHALEDVSAWMPLPQPYKGE